MSNYRRLISYIYAYEGGVKGKNIGFAKIEVRGEQCRIHVNVKKVYVGSNDIGVYLLTPKEEVLLGRIFIRGGSGEFRMSVHSSNIEGSGCSMDDCYGLTIHDVESTWQCYTTIWDDAVTQAAEMTLEDVTAENVRRQELQKEREQQKAQKEAEQQTGSKQPEMIVNLPISEEIERELEEEELRNAVQMSVASVLPAEDVPSDTVKEISSAAVQDTASAAARDAASAAVQDTPPAAAQEIPSDAVLPEEEQVPEEQVVPEKDPELEAESVSGKDPELETESVSGKESKTETECVQSEALCPGPENIEKLQELDRLEQEAQSENRLWNQLQRRYAKVLAFDYDKGCEILSIKPQDIGLLPREIWVYGNNSFLLHGFYNYRHLILAKLNNPEGAPRYLLGVPGHYFSNEKYMASMFGFPHFVLARKQPEEDGRFGYWYTDIRL